MIKDQESTWFQLFLNETAGIRLAVTGVGEIAAAAVISSVCSVHKPTQDDLLLNIGICAHTTKNDGIFLCNKIIEKATGRTFYPDMLYYHNFAEETIVTGMRPYISDNDDSQTTTGDSTGILYDMEAASIYQTAIHFFAPHQMIFLKIVSDRGAVEDVSQERTVSLMEKYKDCILKYIEQISATMQEIGCRKSLLNQEEELRIEKFCTDLHCSKAMKDSMRQYIHYLKLTKMDYVSAIEDMYAENLLPCKDKKEGKLHFEEFKRRLF